MLLVIAAAAVGCSSADIRRVIEIEHEVARLEAELSHVREWGVDPCGLEMPPGLGREIESLCVYPPYVETAVSVFPGFLFPGLGAHAIGDPQTGWSRLGEAYTGVGEFAMGTGLTAVSLGAAAACAYDGSGGSDGIFETLALGVTYMVAGPVHYLGAWFGDIASTYGSREDLAVRVEALKMRYRKFLADYESACRAYRSGK